MALRSLVGKMKALPLPRQVLGSRAFATAPKPKAGSWAEMLAKFEDLAFRNGSVDEYIRALDASMHKQLKPIRDKRQRENRIYHGLLLLVTVGGFGSAGYIRRSSKKNPYPV
ncbi:hypothetical protein U9M48_033190 [Paspalum notatum var. saurae]|uniref:Uncharacterized protein n=1 Tax=Paspalum notatum var. saurae TaxID=547442 RepID=A0AAQ3U7P7_PASNO